MCIFIFYKCTCMKFEFLTCFETLNLVPAPQGYVPISCPLTHLLGSIKRGNIIFQVYINVMLSRKSLQNGLICTELKTSTIPLS